MPHDPGRFKNNAGERIADISANDPIALADAGIVVHRIPVYSWLMNQTTMIIDSKNRPHVITYHLPEPFRPDIVEHGPPESVAQYITSLADAGADAVCFFPSPFDPLDDVEETAARLLPLLS